MTYGVEQQNSKSWLGNLIKSKWLTRATIIATSLALSVVAVSLVEKNSNPLSASFTDAQRPVTSMVFLQRTNNLEYVTCIQSSPEDQGSINPCTIMDIPEFREQMLAAINNDFSFRITGSAALVGHDLSRNSSYVLSAYHVCNDFNQRYLSISVPGPSPAIMVFKYVPNVMMTDFYGNRYEGEMVREDEGNDICLLESNQIMEDVVPVKVASEPPEPGDRIYNIASPHGISQPGAVLSYEGYHAGILPAGRIIENPHYLNAIPTAPGSSGSIILNDRGEVISVVSYGFLQRRMGATTMWPNASGGPSLEAIQRLIRTRKIQ